MQDGWIKEDRKIYNIELDILKGKEFTIQEAIEFSYTQQLLDSKIAPISVNQDKPGQQLNQNTQAKDGSFQQPSQGEQQEQQSSIKSHQQQDQKLSNSIGKTLYDAPRQNTTDYSNQNIKQTAAVQGLHTFQPNVQRSQSTNQEEAKVYEKGRAQNSLMSQQIQNHDVQGRDDIKDSIQKADWKVSQGQTQNNHQYLPQKDDLMTEVHSKTNLNNGYQIKNAGQQQNKNGNQVSQPHGKHSNNLQILPQAVNQARQVTNRSNEVNKSQENSQDFISLNEQHVFIDPSESRACPIQILYERFWDKYLAIQIPRPYTFHFQLEDLYSENFLSAYKQQCGMQQVSRQDVEIFVWVSVKVGKFIALKFNKSLRRLQFTGANKIQSQCAEKGKFISSNFVDDKEWQNIHKFTDQQSFKENYAKDMVNYVDQAIFSNPNDQNFNFKVQDLFTFYLSTNQYFWEILRTLNTLPFGAQYRTNLQYFLKNYLPQEIFSVPQWYLNQWTYKQILTIKIMYEQFTDESNRRNKEKVESIENQVEAFLSHSKLFGSLDTYITNKINFNNFANVHVAMVLKQQGIDVVTPEKLAVYLSDNYLQSFYNLRKSIDYKQIQNDLSYFVMDSQKITPQQFSSKLLGDTQVSLKNQDPKIGELRCQTSNEWQTNEKQEKIGQSDIKKFNNEVENQKNSNHGNINSTKENINQMTQKLDSVKVNDKVKQLTQDSELKKQVNQNVNSKQLPPTGLETVQPLPQIQLHSLSNQEVMMQQQINRLQQIKQPRAPLRVQVSDISKAQGGKTNNNHNQNHQIGTTKRQSQSGQPLNLQQVLNVAQKKTTIKYDYYTLMKRLKQLTTNQPRYFSKSGQQIMNYLKRSDNQFVSTNFCKTMLIQEQEFRSQREIYDQLTKQLGVLILPQTFQSWHRNSEQGINTQEDYYQVSQPPGLFSQPPGLHQAPPGLQHSSNSQSNLSQTDQQHSIKANQQTNLNLYQEYKIEPHNIDNEIQNEFDNPPGLVGPPGLKIDNTDNYQDPPGLSQNPLGLLNRQSNYDQNPPGLNQVPPPGLQQKPPGLQNRRQFSRFDSGSKTDDWRLTKQISNFQHPNENFNSLDQLNKAKDAENKPILEILQGLDIQDTPQSQRDQRSPKWDSETISNKTISDYSFKSGAKSSRDQRGPKNEVNGSSQQKFVHSKSRHSQNDLAQTKADLDRKDLDEFEIHSLPQNIQHKLNQDANKLTKTEQDRKFQSYKFVNNKFRQLEIRTQRKVPGNDSDKEAAKLGFRKYSKEKLLAINNQTPKSSIQIPKQYQSLQRQEKQDKNQVHENNDKPQMESQPQNKTIIQVSQTSQNGQKPQSRALILVESKYTWQNQFKNLVDSTGKDAFKLKDIPTKYVYTKEELLSLRNSYDMLSHAKLLVSNLPEMLFQPNSRKKVQEDTPRSPPRKQVNQAVNTSIQEEITNLLEGIPLASPTKNVTQQQEIQAKSKDQVINNNNLKNVNQAIKRQAQEDIGIKEASKSNYPDTEYQSNSYRQDSSIQQEDQNIGGITLQKLNAKQDQKQGHTILSKLMSQDSVAQVQQQPCKSQIGIIAGSPGQNLEFPRRLQQQLLSKKVPPVVNDDLLIEDQYLLGQQVKAEIEKLPMDNNIEEKKVQKLSKRLVEQSSGPQAKVSKAKPHQIKKISNISLDLDQFCQLGYENISINTFQQVLLWKEKDQYQYIDPKGKIQGPFKSSKIIQWYKSGKYFDDQLLIRPYGFNENQDFYLIKFMLKFWE